MSISLLAPNNTFYNSKLADTSYNIHPNYFLLNVNIQTLILALTDEIIWEKKKHKELTFDIEHESLVLPFCVNLKEHWTL